MIELHNINPWNNVILSRNVGVQHGSRILWKTQSQNIFGVVCPDIVFKDHGIIYDYVACTF